MAAMPRGRNHGLLIAGAGVAGSLAALAMARLRPEVPLLLVGEGPHFGGGRTLFLLDEELGEEERDLLAPLVSHRWEGFYVAFSGGGGRKLKLACHAVPGERIDAAVRAALRPEQYRLDAKIVAVRDSSLLLHGGETLKGDGALDARGPASSSVLELAWRRSAARTYHFPAPHRVDLPVAADAAVAQGEGCRFFACLPLSADRLRVEEIHHSSVRTLDEAAAGARIEDYLALRGWEGGALEAKESAVCPLALGGDFPAYWRIGGARVAKLGARGGFPHPATGCPLAEAARSALLLTRQADFRGEALHDLFEGRAVALWKKREIYRGFSRLLLKGGACALDELFRLEPETIAAFHAERLGLVDKRRITAIGAC